MAEKINLSERLKNFMIPRNNYNNSVSIDSICSNNELTQEEYELFFKYGNDDLRKIEKTKQEIIEDEKNKYITMEDMIANQA
jgi:hypothetical protein